jgi:hypothetical protein
MLANDLNALHPNNHHARDDYSHKVRQHSRCLQGFLIDL